LRAAATAAAGERSNAAVAWSIQKLRIRRVKRNRSQKNKKKKTRNTERNK